MSCDPQELILAARCLSCLTENDRDLVKTNLLCEIRDSLVSSSGVVGHVIVDSGTLTVDGTVNVVIPALPTIMATQVSVGIAQVAVPTANLASRKTVTFKALGANGDKIYIGLTGVTALTGFELDAGSSVDIDADSTVNFFAISGSGTQKCSCLEIA